MVLENGSGNGSGKGVVKGSRNGGGNFNITQVWIRKPALTNTYLIGMILYR